MTGLRSAHRSALTRWLLPAPLRWSLVELCRRTTHEGWERLLEATTAGGGVVLIASAGSSWPVAARALAAWAGPLHLALPEGAGDRRLARLLCAGGPESPRLAPDPASIAAALAAGGKVLFVLPSNTPLDRPTPPIQSGTPALPVAVEQPARGRYRLVIGEPEARST